MKDPLSDVSPAPGGSVAGALEEGTRRLARSGSTSPRLDAEVLLAHVLRVTRTHLMVRFREVLAASDGAEYQSLLARRQRGEPVAYLTGVREFWGLEFQVTLDVLIPRPETEHLVEEALRRLPTTAAARIVDLGTGSGCLAVALAKERPRARVLALDLSAPALRVARSNAERHGVTGRLQFLRGDLLESLRPAAACPDLIVCNPPYISRADYHHLPPDVRDFEPRRALTDDRDGLHHYRRLVPPARELLRPDGHLILELGAGQADDVLALFDATLWDVMGVVKDLQQIDRCLIARKRPGGKE